MATLAEIAGELYALAPAEFVSARNERAAALRGDRELADAVKGLRRPAPAAWVVNLLARERPDEVDGLIELGTELRRAQESGDRDEFTRLGRERREAVAALVDAGGELAEQDGHAVNRAVLDQVAETLQAAMFDPEAADAVRGGVLLTPLTSVGFAAVDVAGAIAIEGGAPAAPRRKSGGRPALRVVKDADAELKRARAEARETERAAEREFADAEAEATELGDKAAAIEARRSELEEELADLEQELERTRAGLARAERDLRAIDRERGSAERTLDRARTTLDRARERRAALD